MKKLLMLGVCLISTLATTAQTQDRKWSFGVQGGVIQYHGDLGRDWYKTDNTMYGFGGITVSRYLWDFLDISASYNRGTLGFDSSVTGFKGDFSAGNVNLRFKPLGTKYIVSPYGFVGVGAILFDNQLNFHKEKIDSAWPTAGGGLNIRLTPALSLNLQETFMFTNNDARDGVVDGDTNDDYLLHSAGLTYSFGHSKDSDNDGVPDSRDNCPDTPLNVAVDKNGCPQDKDKDGVADYLDNCPDVAGSTVMNGCPDRDNDGVSDADDRCPDTKGSAALKGCPDADGDGVADLDDKCPNSRAGSRVDATGCPLDDDRDGVMNDADRCPDVAGPESLKGCPDGDGDGVADIDDRCPKVKGTMENKGCPEIAKQDVVRINYIGSKLFFETASDKLKVASLTLLDELVKILNKYEAASLAIEGHTDSDGSDAYNQTLSQKRTESVKKYLISKGISDSRLTATGFGETKPVASNKTSLGKAKNRRVELKTSY
jgi:OOP family OmpA-OmpF porin